MFGVVKSVGVGGGDWRAKEVDIPTPSPSYTFSTYQVVDHAGIENGHLPVDEFASVLVRILPHKAIDVI